MSTAPGSEARPLRLGILATHPIQYHAPLFRELASRPGVELTVFFCHRPTPREQGVGFGVEFQWDVDLTSGYRHFWLRNVSKRPGVTHFTGCDTPGIADFIAGRRSPDDGTMGPRDQGTTGPRNQGTPGRPSALAPRPSPLGPRPSALAPRGRPFDLFIVHGWAWKSCWQAFFACWRTGTPLAVRSDSQLPQGRLTPGLWLKQALKRLVYPRFIRRFDCCLPYGQRSAAYFRQYGGRRIVIAPHAVDNGWFAAQAAAQRQHRAELRRAWGIPGDAFCFLFCGKLEPKKRPMDSLCALASLQGRPPTEHTDRKPDNGSPAKPASDTHGGHPVSGSASQLSASTPPPTVHLLMVGDGELRAECEAYAREQQLPVTFAGFVNQSDMPGAYAAADCLVLPSDERETWGLVVNEAMACGIPVIVSSSCGCAPDLVVPGVTGMLFPVGRVSELATAMRATAARETPAASHPTVQNHLHAFSFRRAADCLVAAVARQ